LLVNRSSIAAFAVLLWLANGAIGQSVINVLVCPDETADVANAQYKRDVRCSADASAVCRSDRFILIRGALSLEDLKHFLSITPGRGPIQISASAASVRINGLCYVRTGRGWEKVVTGRNPDLNFP
jgi:hypothetical protein